MKRAKQAQSPLESQTRAWLREAATTLKLTEARCSGAVAEAAEAIIHCLETGGTVYFCGNGGSAADSQHLATEFAGRFQVDRAPLAAVALTTNSSALTAIGNDYGYDHVFARLVEAHGVAGDVAIAISTSGNSRNVLDAVAVARQRGLATIGLCGRGGGKLAGCVDVPIVVPSDRTPRIQEAHIAIIHVLCELVDEALFPE